MEHYNTQDSDIEEDSANDVKEDSDIEDSNNKYKDRNMEVGSTKESPNSFDTLPIKIVHMILDFVIVNQHTFSFN